MFGLMIRIRRDELRCGNRRRRAFRHFVGIMDILDYARPRQHETGLDGPDLIEDIMGKPRKEQPEAESIFANNPFIEGLFEWMDSPEGQQSIAVAGRRTGRRQATATDLAGSKTYSAKRTA